MFNFTVSIYTNNAHQSDPIHYHLLHPYIIGDSRSHPNTDRESRESRGDERDGAKDKDKASQEESRQLRMSRSDAMAIINSSIRLFHFFLFFFHLISLQLYSHFPLSKFLCLSLYSLSTSFVLFLLLIPLPLPPSHFLLSLPLLPLSSASLFLPLPPFLLLSLTFSPSHTNSLPPLYLFLSPTPKFSFSTSEWRCLRSTTQLFPHYLPLIPHHGSACEKKSCYSSFS